MFRIMYQVTEDGDFMPYKAIYPTYESAEDVIPSAKELLPNCIWWIKNMETGEMKGV